MFRRKIIKLAALTAVSAGLMFSTLPAAAADVTMNLGFGAPMKSIYGDLSTIVKAKVEEYTGGRVEVKIRCCNQISTEDEGFKAMQLGTVDAFIITANNISPHWPLMDVTVLPYIFQNTAHLERVVDGPVGELMKKGL